MPYEGEFASYAPIKRLTESKRVKELVEKYDIVPAPLTGCGTGDVSGSTFVTTESLPRTKGWIPDYVISVDGSLAEVPVDNGYPGAEVAYMTVATVLLDLKKMQDRKSTRLNSSHSQISYAVFCLKRKSASRTRWCS